MRVDRESAAAALAHGVAGGLRRLARGPLREIADVYVPFRLFEVDVARRGRHERAVLGLDAVAGTLDLYRFDRVPQAGELVDVTTRNRLDPTLSAADAHEIVGTRMKRLIYRRVGLLAAGWLGVEIQPVAAVVHVPYWVGLFGRRETASLVVMDAARRAIEGVKVRRLIGRWLTE
jgi:hypothetical protein